MQFYTIQQISEMSGKSQKTIRRHIAAQKLKRKRCKINIESQKKIIKYG